MAWLRALTRSNSVTTIINVALKTLLAEARIWQGSGWSLQALVEEVAQGSALRQLRLKAFHGLAGSIFIACAKAPQIEINRWDDLARTGVRKNSVRASVLLGKGVGLKAKDLNRIQKAFVSDSLFCCI